MYRDRTDLQESFYLCRFSLGGEPKQDYDAHLAGQIDALEKLRGKGKRMALVICHDPGFPPPDAETRHRVAELTGAPDYDAFTAIITKNRVIRGVVTAINWMRRRQQQETIHATGAEAVAWLEKQRGEPLPKLRAALQEFGVE